MSAGEKSHPRIACPDHWDQYNPELDLGLDYRLIHCLDEFDARDLPEADTTYRARCACEHSECDHEYGDSDGTEDSIATTTAATTVHSLPQSVCSDVTAHTDCSDLLDFKNVSRRNTSALRDLLEPCFDTFALEDSPAPSAAAMLLQVGFLPRIWFTTIWKSN
jgi:hypothetical protein